MCCLVILKSCRASVFNLRNIVRNEVIMRVLLSISLKMCIGYTKLPRKLLPKNAIYDNLQNNEICYMQYNTTMV